MRCDYEPEAQEPCGAESVGHWMVRPNSWSSYAPFNYCAAHRDELLKDMRDMMGWEVR